METIYLAGTYNDGVFFSSNGGNNWSMVNNGLPANVVVNVMATSGSNVFAGTSHGSVYMASINGGSWTAINSGLPVAR